ncbi:hybrid sensor histidine kinase/response regulator [Natronorubrum aibiense]|uniref:histidine kinase n=1 Tax=Natronorubrum aibiense TaxID=348826 RepID=A0A5P9P137_9EURY|nr:DUF484 family protein [Natronorubrum aibiense]QFU81550.1 DUF484 family protein [Natronorubrum aibiense]
MMTARVLCLIPAPSARRETTASLSELLTTASISAASTLERACSRLESASFDAVVVDHDAAVLDAVTAVERLRGRFRSLPIVVFPQDGSEALASAVLGAGGTDYVHRDAGYGVLADRLERALADSATRADSDCDVLDDSHSDCPARLHQSHSARSFKQAVEQAGHSIYITAPDGTIQYVNPAFEAVTGYSAAEAIGSTPRLLKSGVHGSSFYQELWRTILTGDVWENQIVNRRKDGTTYTVNQTIAPITDADGTISNFVAVNADISDQKRRERQLRRLHEAVGEWLEATTPDAVATRTVANLEELFDHECSAVFLSDDASGELRPAAVSEAVAETFEIQSRYDEDDGIVRRVFEMGEAELYDDVRDASGVCNAKTPIRCEMACPLGEHGVLLVASRSAAAFDEADTALLRVVASNLEATLDRLSRERELERQKERFEKFAHVVSHDLRNPLTVAMGELERARETNDEMAFEEVVQAHERIATIIDDLLWLAREDRGIDEPELVSLAAVASNAWEAVAAPDVAFELEGDRRVLADPGRLQQLFENLFRNAVDHGSTSPESHARQDTVSHGATSSRPQVADTSVAADTELTVRVGRTDDGFYVADTGVGIPDAERERILETGYTTADDGTGLGLSIVQTIVDAHGWSLEITDSAAGGARFEIQTGAVD